MFYIWSSEYTIAMSSERGKGSGIHILTWRRSYALCLSKWMKMTFIRTWSTLVLYVQTQDQEHNDWKGVIMLWRELNAEKLAWLSSPTCVKTLITQPGRTPDAGILKLTSHHGIRRFSGEFQTIQCHYSFAVRITLWLHISISQCSGNCLSAFLCNTWLLKSCQMS